MEVKWNGRKCRLEVKVRKERSMIMQKGQNYNHPKRGSQIKVEPIKDLRDIKTIKTLLADNPRDLALFTLGINTNLRASDLLQVTVGMVRDKEEFELKEKKTGKWRRITLNAACKDTIRCLLGSGVYQYPWPIFPGKSKKIPLTVPSVSRLVKSWCHAVNLQGNYAAHTLRKTWGYHQRVTFGVDLERLMVCFNHNSPRQTLTYICVQPEEIRDVYSNEL